MEGSSKKKYHRGRRKKKKGGVFSTIILIIALIVFVFSTFQLYKIYSGYSKGEKEYEGLEKIAITTDTDDEGGEERYRVDFDALREINPDVVAWIRFEEPAIINYPVVQGKDNEDYLYKTFKGYDNTMGTIFVDAYNNPDFRDKNTIIYGHYMYNGTMFNELEQYHKEEFWKQHPYFYIYTPDGAEIKYQIYAAGIVKDTAENYTCQFADDAAFESFVHATKTSGYYETGVEVGTDAQIVTLSTCTGANNDERTVIHGVKVGVKE